MNRLEMKDIIQERSGSLLAQNDEKWKKNEKLRKRFVKDYTTEKIARLSLDQYVIGRGRENKSFCYRIERELDRLGRISGSPAIKFGIYYGITKTDRNRKYRHSKIWGKTPKEAFRKIKQAIINLIIAGERNDFEVIRNSKISPMFLGKILFVYNPEKYSMVYSKDHLLYFISELNLICKSKDNIDLQQSLMKCRYSFRELRNKPPYLWNKLLYDSFGYPPDNQSKKTPTLLDAAKGIVVRANNQLPMGHNGGNQLRANQDYEKLQKQRKRIGDRGEKLVLMYEIEILKKSGRHDLAKKVDHVADKTDGKGYDILSYELDGSEKPIEVKATSSKSFSGGFFLSSNELKKSKDINNYHIYFVSSAMSKKPEISIVKEPEFENEHNYMLSPTIYNVKIIS